MTLDQLIKFNTSLVFSVIGLIILMYSIMACKKGTEKKFVKSFPNLFYLGVIIFGVSVDSFIDAFGQLYNFSNSILLEGLFLFLFCGSILILVRKLKYSLTPKKDPDSIYSAFFNISQVLLGLQTLTGFIYIITEVTRIQFENGGTLW